MNLQKYKLMGHLWLGSFRSSKHFSNVKENQEYLKIVCKYLNINESKAQHICFKHPVVKKIDEVKMKSIVNTLHDLGFAREVLIDNPALFGILPVTLKFRYKVLAECGFVNISSSHLVSYLTLVKQKTIATLKNSGDIPLHTNVENRLASYMTQWPTSLTTLIAGDVNDSTLYALRLKIIQRYLELVLDLTKEEFYRGIQTYPTIKHRPLEFIDETLKILESEIMLPRHKIKSNLYLIHSDPDNLKNIIYNFRSIGGIDVKEIIRIHPKLGTKTCTTLFEIKNILQVYGISNEAQKRCFDIYTLAPGTVRERLEKAKSIPEFNTFYDHPRFLKMIHYNNTAMKRIRKLYDNNKKCLSLNIISGSTAHYEVFQKAPGDRLGKGKDLLFCIAQSLDNKYSMNEIRRVIKRHPFWINIPLVHVKYVCQMLSKKFSHKDIYENCPILFYPWNKIRELIDCFGKKKSHKELSFYSENIDIDKLSKSQKLSLVLYMLEKNHYFSGNGVWTEEKNKNIIDVPYPEKLQNCSSNNMSL